MNIYRKICVAFSNFIKKNNCLDKPSQKVKKYIKVQFYIIRLNQKRSNIYYQSIEHKIVTQNILVKSKIHFS